MKWPWQKREPVTQFGMPYPEGWDKLLDDRNFQIVWARVSRSDIWKDNLEPHFRRMLIDSLLAMAKADDPALVVRHQEQARMLSFILEQPLRAEMMESAAREHAIKTGKLKAPEMETANGRR